jgi:hypothetical protein
VVEFKLIYQGQLRAATAGNSRMKEKHAIRKELHKQLKELWSIHPTLSKMAAANVGNPASPTGVYQKLIEATADKYARCGYRFVPLVTENLSLSAAIDIIFLRRDPPGRIVSSGGDIDNRLKTLFDAFRMPNNCDELPKGVPDADENPFFVLLEDDSQITKVSVTTERLLLPLAPGADPNDVHLVINVKVNVVEVSYFHGMNWMFLG